MRNRWRVKVTQKHEAYACFCVWVCVYVCVCVFVCTFNASSSASWPLLGFGLVKVKISYIDNLSQTSDLQNNFLGVDTPRSKTKYVTQTVYTV